jgi:hypothetical protein
MQHTAVITLMYLMFGQFLILTFGAFILWWVGDFSSTPIDDQRVDGAAKDRKIVARNVHKPSGAESDGLPALAHDDHSIQPQAPERMEAEIEPAHVRADNDEKTLLRSAS